jgi:hypothetical protein
LQREVLRPAIGPTFDLRHEAADPTGPGALIRPPRRRSFLIRINPAAALSSY